MIRDRRPTCGEERSARATSGSWSEQAAAARVTESTKSQETGAGGEGLGLERVRGMGRVTYWAKTASKTANRNTCITIYREEKQKT